VGVEGGLILTDQIGQSKGVVGLEGSSTNDLQLLSTTGMRFYTGSSDLITNGERGRWLLNGHLLIGKTTDDGPQFQVDGAIGRGYQNAIVASTTQTQGQGALTKDINIVGTVANANDTVTLPSAAPGMEVFIRNNGAQTLKIFPASGDNINATGVNTAVTLASGASATYRCADTTNWYS
jgi:hypothetical protein